MCIALFVICVISQTKLCLCHVFCNFLFCFNEDLVNPVTWASFLRNKKTKERIVDAYDMVCAWRRSPWLVRDTTWLSWVTLLHTTVGANYSDFTKDLLLFGPAYPAIARQAHHGLTSWRGRWRRYEPARILWRPKALNVLITPF
jgi:hypothetical protein